MSKERLRRKIAVPRAREAIERRIYLVRGERVMLDADLAALYGVETGYLNLAVRHNLARFPADFMFQLRAVEAASARSAAPRLAKPSPQASKRELAHL